MVRQIPSPMNSNLSLVLASLILIASIVHAVAYEGTKSEWHGFERYDFQLGDRNCILVAPKSATEGHPWVWRARFFGHEPQADIALLKKGYHIAYCEVGGLFGNSEAVAHWDSFYAHVVGKYDLARKVALEGMSRGGLIIYNWASANPDKVACLYGDAPVCDIRSWPGGKGSGKGSEADWQKALVAHGITEETAESFKGCPVDRLQPLAKAKIPILHVVGDADNVVPVSENSDIIEERYLALGGSFEVIRKPGIGHHPHALEDPERIIAFIESHVKNALAEKLKLSGNVLPRSGLGHSGRTFQETAKGTVAFIGGSITEMKGYRPMVNRVLEQRFPDTEFTFIDAGISSTCSTTGAFRLQGHILSQGKVDLLFVEFAVNDDQDAAHAHRESVRGLEGIIRHARQVLPSVDIVVTYFVNPPILKALQSGAVPVSIAAHQTVTEHYQVPSIHLAREVAERINNKQLTWKQFGGTHPAPYGNRLCTDLIEQLFDHAWSPDSLSVRALHVRKLPTPIDPDNYERGRFLDFKAVQLPKSGWQFGVPSWKELKGNCRTRFRDMTLLSSSVSNKILTIDFQGSAVGAYVLAGPDAGVAETSIDGGSWQKTPLYHRHSEGLHYPRTVVFGAALANRKHTLRLRVSADPNHGGSAMRIVRLVAN